MTSLNVSLPEGLRQYVENQVVSGDWGTPSEYIRELIRQDKERRLTILEEELREGIASKTLQLSADEVRSSGLVAVLRKKVEHR